MIEHEGMPQIDERMSGTAKAVPADVQAGYWETFLYHEVVKHWHRLSTELFDAPCLPAFKRHLDNDLLNML